MSASNDKQLRLEYENKDYPVSVSYIDLADPSNSYAGWTWHEDIKIVIINNGTAQVNSDDQSLRLLPGQAVVIGRNVMHSIIQFGGENCSYYVITFHPDFILGPTTGSISEKYLSHFDDPNLKFMIFDESIEWHKEVLDYLNSTIVANVIHGPGYELKSKANLCLFVSTLAEHISDTELELSDNDYPISMDEQRVKDAMNFIREHYTERLSLDIIADYIHISKSECCRCFKRSISMTPFEYLVKYRIYSAAKMLNAPEYLLYSIAEIAEAVGFNNFSYFSKQFGKYMNCTPRQYRNNSKNHKPNTDLISFL